MARLMSLQIGQQLGLYEITASVGKGGMGEVYRARDRRLGREVAIKILPREFTKDPDRLARFERELACLRRSITRTLALFTVLRSRKVFGLWSGVRRRRNFG